MSQYSDVSTYLMAFMTLKTVVFQNLKKFEQFCFLYCFLFFFVFLLLSLVSYS